MINSDKKKVTVDFFWSTEGKDVNAGGGFYVKHHHTTEYGPTISISESEDDYTSFPAKLLVETVDFLRSEGVIDSASGKKVEKSEEPKKIALSAPVIENATEIDENDPNSLLIDGSDPITSFDGDGVPQDAPNTPQDAPGTTQTDKEVSASSVQNMKEERTKAVEKSQKKTVIKKAHKRE